MNTIHARTLAAAWAALITAGVAAAPLPDGGVGGAPGRGPAASDPVAEQRGTGTLKDAIQLCSRLGGTEREVCLQQAQENQERALAPPIGGTPGSGAAGAVEGSRGNAR